MFECQSAIRLIEMKQSIQCRLKVAKSIKDFQIKQKMSGALLFDSLFQLIETGRDVRQWFSWLIWRQMPACEEGLCNVLDCTLEREVIIRPSKVRPSPSFPFIIMIFFRRVSVFLLAFFCFLASFWLWSAEFTMPYTSTCVYLTLELRKGKLIM